MCLRPPRARWQAIRAGKQSYWDGVKQRFGIVADFLVLDALRTLRNPNASPGQKALAAATLFGPGKVAGKAAGRVGKLARHADDVRPPGVKKVGPSYPINSKYAGTYFPLPPELAKKYPQGLRFRKTGYPDFSPYRSAQVKINVTGHYGVDARRANKKAGLARTPDGYTWHHVEDTKTMQLVPKDLHEFARHHGGVAVKKQQGLQQAGRGSRGPQQPSRSSSTSRSGGR